MILYNVFIAFSMIQVFSQLGLFVQNKIQSEAYDSDMNEQGIQQTVFILYLTAIFIFYITAMSITFMFYRECKHAIHEKSNGNGQPAPTAQNNSNYGAMGQQPQSFSGGLFGANQNQTDASTTGQSNMNNNSITGNINICKS